MDSLRYWVSDMHVDGFRFDDSASLRRELHDGDQPSPFLALLAQDPVLRQAKLIAEPPSDAPRGEHGERLPLSWSEWNIAYRNTVRDFWRGAPVQCTEFVSRLTGSADLYGVDNKRPRLGINCVTTHDGFTLHGFSAIRPFLVKPGLIN